MFYSENHHKEDFMTSAIFFSWNFDFILHFLKFYKKSKIASLYFKMTLKIKC